MRGDRRLVEPEAREAADLAAPGERDTAAARRRRSAARRRLVSSVPSGVTTVTPASASACSGSFRMLTSATGFFAWSTRELVHEAVLAVGRAAHLPVAEGVAHDLHHLGLRPDRRRPGPAGLALRRPPGRGRRLRRRASGAGASGAAGASAAGAAGARARLGGRALRRGRRASPGPRRARRAPDRARPGSGGIGSVASCCSHPLDDCACTGDCHSARRLSTAPWRRSAEDRAQVKRAPQGTLFPAFATFPVGLAERMGGRYDR